MLSDVLCDTSTRVEALVSAKVDELKGLMRVLVGECATKQTINDKLDAINDVLSGIEKGLHDEHDATLGVVKANTARLEALGSLMKGVTGDAKNLQRGVDKTRSDVEGIMRCVGAVPKAVLAVDGKTDTTTSKLCSVESKVEKLATNNDKRHEALKKKVDVISSRITETKACVDEVGHVFTHQNQENIRLASSFSWKDLTVMESGIRALKRWTVKASANIVYDSRVDPFTDQGLFDKGRGKSNIAVVCFTTDGHVFAGSTALL